QTAAGWGWSTGSAPAQGRMDLLTVVTHELGHALGFEHSDTGVMEAALAPGVRLVPEALTGSSDGVVPAAATDGSTVSAGATSSRPTALSRGGELGGAQPHVSLSTLGGIDTAFVTGMRGSVTLPAAGVFQDGPSSPRRLAGVLLHLGQQTPAVLAT